MTVGICEVCGWGHGLSTSLNNHHCIPRKRGGTDEPENILPLCPNCHAVAHSLCHGDRMESMSTRRGTVQAIQAMLIQCGYTTAVPSVPQWYEVLMRPGVDSPPTAPWKSPIQSLRLFEWRENWNKHTKHA